MYFPMNVATKPQHLASIYASFVLLGFVPSESVPKWKIYTSLIYGNKKRSSGFFFYSLSDTATFFSKSSFLLSIIAFFSFFEINL